MKVNKFILAGVAVLGLGMTACNNDDVPSVGNPTEGNTFVGMYISTMKDVMTKAVARERLRMYSPLTWNVSCRKAWSQKGEA